MKALQILLVTLVGMLAVSCGANTPVEELKDICTEVENNWEDYSEQDWIELQEKLDLIDQKLDKYECTDEEIREIGKVRGRIMKYQSQKAMEDVHKGMKDAANMLDGMLDGFLSEDEE